MIVLDENLGDGISGCDIARKVVRGKHGGRGIVVGFSGDSMATQHAEAGCDLSWSKTVKPEDMMRDLRKCTAASPVQKERQPLSNGGAAAQKQLPPSERPYGLQKVHEKFGGENYSTLCQILVNQSKNDFISIKEHLAARNWAECKRLAHKLKGTVLTLSLDCCPDALALDLALKHLVENGDGEEEAILALGATFTDKFGAVVDYITEHPS